MPRKRAASSKRPGSARRGAGEPRESPPIVVRRSSINGRGGFASRRIEPGELIIEYEGERIPWSEANRRYPDEPGRLPHTVLFELNARTVIDGGVGGNDSRFINHSCHPNCEAIEERNRIVIRALRRIRAGEELTYDYALPRDADLGPAEDAIYPCRCRTRRCRGTILEPAKKKRRRRKRDAT